MLDNTSSLHRLATELTNRYLVAVIPINEHKQPLAITVVDKRNRLATVEELEDYFGPKGSIKAGRLAILLDSPIPLCALDLDGTGVAIFQKKVSLKFSEQMKFKINNSMKTETPNNGLHILFRLRKEDFPSGIKSKKYWTDTGNGKKHNEISLMGTGHYVLRQTIDELEAIKSELQKSKLNEPLSEFHENNVNKDVNFEVQQEDVISINDVLIPQPNVSINYNQNENETCHSPSQVEPSSRTVILDTKDLF